MAKHAPSMDIGCAGQQRGVLLFCDIVRSREEAPPDSCCRAISLYHGLAGSQRHLSLAMQGATCGPAGMAFWAGQGRAGRGRAGRLGVALISPIPPSARTLLHCSLLTPSMHGCRCSRWPGGRVDPRCSNDPPNCNRASVAYAGRGVALHAAWHGSRDAPDRFGIAASILPARLHCTSLVALAWQLLTAAAICRIFSRVHVRLDDLYLFMTG